MNCWGLAIKYPPVVPDWTFAAFKDGERGYVTYAFGVPPKIPPRDKWGARQKWVPLPWTGEPEIYQIKPVLGEKGLYGNLMI